MTYEYPHSESVLDLLVKEDAAVKKLNELKGEQVYNTKNFDYWCKELESERERIPNYKDYAVRTINQLREDIDTTYDEIDAQVEVIKGLRQRIKAVLDI